MPAITDRTQREPLLKIQRLGHGTLECTDITKTRRFYEEVLGLEVIQTSLVSLMVRKDTLHTYAVVETGRANKEMNMLNHNGLEVTSPQEVDRAYELLLQVKDEYGIRKLQKPRRSHGDYAFYFSDLDGNWWEIVAVRPGGYAADFGEDDRDLTGRHELDGVRASARDAHTHDADFRGTLHKRNS